MTARFAAEDYGTAALALLPRGAVWSNDAASVQGRLLAALALSLWRSDAAAQQLLGDAFPGTTAALLAEWEATLGLPDPVVGPATTDDQRRDQVIARLVGAGGQSRARFIGFAAQLGFAITIGNFAPFRAGRSSAGSPVYSEAWSDVWSIHVAANSSGLDPAALKALLDEIRPATTTVIVN